MKKETNLYNASALEELQISRAELASRHHIVVQSAGLKHVIHDAVKAARSKSTILITGESGTGKELIARLMHNVSPRTEKPFVVVNCGALPETLLETELFGHEKGAFTGAAFRKIGLFETAHEGTIFLDEIGEMSPTMQVKLLRVIQEGTFNRIGSSATIVVDVRVISATNKQLQEEVKKRKFREDLYYRLNVIHLFIPPLRERKEDIPLLLDHFLDKASYALNKKKPTSPPELLTLLAAYDFPGNVRELEALVTDAVARHRSGVLSMERFKEVIGRDLRSSRSSLSGEGTPLDISAHFPTLKEAEDFLIREALKRSHGNQRIAASFLGITSQALNKRLRRSEQSYFHRVDESLE
jgi:transcriptional regulator with PAS, ATPase and Fis domain